MPSICVCTAEATAVLQILELFTTTLGAFAVGGVELVTTVDETVLSAPRTAFIVLLKKNINMVANATPIINGVLIYHKHSFHYSHKD